MSGKVILSIDQGTSGTKCLLVDHHGAVIGRGYAALSEQHPRPGWVEQDPEELWGSVQYAVQDCLSKQAGVEIAAIGLSTQRESLLLWERISGQAIAPLVSWQDQRAALTPELLKPEVIQEVRSRSGLPLDPMFSASKGAWLLDEYDPERLRANAGELCLGTVDSWLLFKLTGQHLTERGNASRTQLLNVHTGDWDEKLLQLFRIPRQVLPELVDSDGPFPAAQDLLGVPANTPICAVLGDSHAALFAHAAFTPGTVKATYGTGSSVMGLLPDEANLDSGVVLSIAWSARGQIQRAAEGNIRSAGATLRWLAELLQTTPAELAQKAIKLKRTSVVIVPGFGGLGAPYWDENAVGLISNLTLGTTQAELAYAALDSIAQQVTDVVAAVQRSGNDLQVLHTDGGPTANAQLMQRQADLLGLPVHRSKNVELSALGVAHLAGLGIGIWTEAELVDLPRDVEVYQSMETAAEREEERLQWQKAVSRARLKTSMTTNLDLEGNYATVS